MFLQLFLIGFCIIVSMVFIVWLYEEFPNIFWGILTAILLIFVSWCIGAVVIDVYREMISL